MKNYGIFKVPGPEHGLNILKTAEAGDRAGVAHLARYWWAYHMLVEQALKLSRPSRVLDLGCGGGYGSRILFEVPGTEITGLDVASTAILTAKGEYSGEFLSFDEYSLEQEWEDDPRLNNVDMIVAFEVFELLRHREMFLLQVAKALAPAGVFLLSANFAGRQLCHFSPEDAFFHYSTSMLQQVLQRYFGRVQFALEEQSSAFKFFTGFQPKVDAAWKGEGPAPAIGDNVMLCSLPLK